MNEVRRGHFAQNRKLIGQFHGREIKTLGDSFMAAFRSVDAALDYAWALQGNTGHPQVQIRAGIHIGPMHVEAGDVFGGTVNFAARVIGAIQGAEIWLSDHAKEDIDRLGSSKHKHLTWERHAHWYSAFRRRHWDQAGWRWSATRCCFAIRPTPSAECTNKSSVSPVSLLTQIQDSLTSFSTAPSRSSALGRTARKRHER